VKKPTSSSVATPGAESRQALDPGEPEISWGDKRETDELTVKEEENC
jgi:hypothetical protein